MYDYTEEEYAIMATEDFLLSINYLSPEVLERVKMKIEVEIRERDLAKENV